MSNACWRHAHPVFAGEIGGVCLAEGAGGGMSGAQAASERAARRRNQLMAGFEGSTPYLGDIESAEADYEDPEEMWVQCCACMCVCKWGVCVAFCWYCWWLVACWAGCRLVLRLALPLVTTAACIHAFNRSFH